MASPLEQEMSRLGLQLIDVLRRRQRAEQARLYTEVLELEERIERLHTAVAIIADRLAAES
jgi:hypothetical protein